ncbi:MAG TPA: radical SAM protein [Candidatus Omnitrophota bacterium]|nr:radical SAM protein [Candidatus Omnitrophota bacterium]HPT39191.1 radical SAM protein [Candidatus Omnitrophota bacterium]
MLNKFYEVKPWLNKVTVENASGKPILTKLDIELTERCNNNCIHCSINLAADDLTAANKELSGEAIKGILKEAVTLGCLTVMFTGGEPLLREDFKELYVFSRKLGLKVVLFTNATLITPQIAELFSKIPPLERIEVTVYGMKKSSYESVTRVGGSFEAARRGMNLLLDKKIPFVVKTALLPSNKHEIDDFEAWAKKIPGMNGQLPSYAMFFQLRNRRNDKLNEQIKNLRLSAQEGLKVLARSKNEYIREMRKFCSKFISPNGDKLFTCEAGMSSGCVDAYGYFQPCLMMRNPDYVYDLKQGSLKDALENFFPRARKQKVNNPDYLKRCAKCFLIGLCAQCPAKSWIEYGTLDTPVEYLCDIAHVQARFLGLIGENEMAWDVQEWKQRVDKFTKGAGYEKRN